MKSNIFQSILLILFMIITNACSSNTSPLRSIASELRNKNFTVYDQGSEIKEVKITGEIFEHGPDLISIGAENRDNKNPLTLGGYVIDEKSAIPLCKELGFDYEGGMTLGTYFELSPEQKTIDKKIVFSNGKFQTNKKVEYYIASLVCCDRIDCQLAGY